MSIHTILLMWQKYGTARGVRGWVGEVFGVDLEVEHSTLKKIKAEVEHYLDSFTKDYRVYRSRKK